MKNTLVSMVLFVALVGACKKKEEAPVAPAGSAAGSAAVVTPTPAPEAKPTEAPMPVAPVAPAGAAVTIASYDDYKKAGLDLFNALNAAFTADGTNCDKLGDDVTKLVADHAATFEAIKAYETSHKDEKKKLDNDADAKAQQKTFETAATPALTACKSNAKLSAALSKLAD